MRITSIRRELAPVLERKLSRHRLSAGKRRRALKNRYEYFSVAADILVLRKNAHRLEVLLIQRKNEPFIHCWALPGGFLDRDEDALCAARRELKEETGLVCSRLIEFGSFSDPERDPRGRTVSIAFYCTVKRTHKAAAGDDAGAVRWFPIHLLPPLAFDHRRVIRQGLSRYRRDLKLRPRGLG